MMKTVSYFHTHPTLNEKDWFTRIKSEKQPLDMIKILQVLSSLSRNGTETFVMNVFRNLDRKKVMFDFLIYHHDPDGFEDEVKEMGGKVYFFTPRSRGLNKYRESLNQFFSEHGKEYVAVHYSSNSFTSILPLKIAKSYGIPVRISHSHNSNTTGLHNKIFHRFNRRRINKFATHYLACSEVAKEWGYRSTSVYSKSRIVKNGIDLKRFSYNPKEREEVRREFHIPQNAVVYGNTGNFRYQKNHVFLIDVFKTIVERRPDSLLMLVGDGELKPEIEEKVRENGIEDKVIFCGIRKDVDRILQAFDVYLFPSHFEGLPFALVEAQAAGLHVVTSTGVSNEVKLTDNILFLPLNKEEWVEKALEVGAKERASIKDSDPIHEYDINVTAKYLIEIYEGKNSK